MSETHYLICLFVALVLTSLTLGVLSLYAHTIMPRLKRLDNATFVKAFQSIDRAINNPLFIMQFFLPVILYIVCYIYARSHQLDEANYILVAGISYLFAVVVTIAVNVPLNDGIKRADASIDQEFDEARLAFNEKRWSQFNLLRTIANLVAVVLTAIALSILI